MNSFSNNKLIAKNTIILYCRMAIVMLVSLYTSRIVLHNLGHIDYGLNNVITSIIVVFSYVSNSMAISTARFFNFELGKGDKGNMKIIFSNAFLIHICLGIITIIIGDIGGLYAINNLLSIPPDRIFACKVLYQFVIFSTFLAIIQVPFTSMIVSHEKMGAYAYVGIIETFAKLMIALSLIIYPYDKLIFFGIMSFGISLFLFLFYFFYCRFNFGQEIKFSINYDKQILKKMTGFTSWIFLGTTSNMLRNTGVNILINIFFGPIVNAANAIAYSVMGAVSNFSFNFTMALKPQIIKTYTAGEQNKCKELIFRGGKFSLFLLLIICYPLLFETNYVLQIWLGQYPSYAPILTRLVLIVILVEVFNNTIDCGIQATGNIKWYQICSSLIMIMNFPLTFLFFFLKCPPYSALIVYISVSIITIYAKVLFMEHLLKISSKEYLWNVLFKCTLVSFACIIIPSIIVQLLDDGFIRFICIITIGTFSSIFIIYMLGLSKEERNLLSSLYKKHKFLICKY